MFAMFSRILKLSGRYKGRIQGAFICAFLESILSKMPIFLAFVILSGFAAGTLTGQTCLYVGLGLAAAVLVQMLVHYLSVPPFLVGVFKGGNAPIWHTTLRSKV